ncbi:Rhodopsin domain-containing protein [Madurella fahalii]|uniref:Rhodopsin domain-containing protein n=1 Tax=Madurella fahalii TaxID=1157608 RepID=A0ABQ0GGI3_9PEZI
MAPQVSASSTLPLSTPTFTPSLPPPPGITPNPENPASLGGLANITLSVCLPCVTVFFLLRTYSRAFVKRTWTAEDALVTISWVGTVAYCGIMRATMSHHGGQHGWDITKEQANEAAYWFNVAAIEYGVMIGMAKLSVLWLYRRIFSPVRWSKFDIACVTLIILVIGFYGTTTIVKIWQCAPREKIWNNSLPGRCLEMKWILNVSGCFNMVTDYLILLLPIQAVRSLRVEKLKRILIVLAFSFGLCAPIFATIGFVVRLRNSGNADTTWYQPEILLWGAAELASCNLCVCFPELAFLFRRKRLAQLGPGGRGERRPTSSNMEAWHEAKPKVPPPTYPYFTKSLMNTIVLSTKNDGLYIELENQASVQNTPAAAFSRR